MLLRAIEGHPLERGVQLLPCRLVTRRSTEMTLDFPPPEPAVDDTYRRGAPRQAGSDTQRGVRAERA